MKEESRPAEGRPWPVAIDIGAGKYGPMGSIDDSDSLLLLPALCDGSNECEVHAIEAIPVKAEQLEAIFRDAFNKYFGRAASTARLQLYAARSGGRVWRRHAWEVRLRYGNLSLVEAAINCHQCLPKTDMYHPR